MTYPYPPPYPQHMTGSAWFNWLPQFAYQQGRELVRPPPPEAPFDWSGVAKIGVVVGVGVVGYLIFRQLVVVSASARGVRRGLIGQES